MTDISVTRKALGDGRYIAMLVALTFAVIGIAWANMSFNGEIEACSAWQLARVYAGTGCVAGLNGEAFHVEGAANIRNLAFFAGGTPDISLGYEIATNRLLFPFLAAWTIPFVGDVLDAVQVSNLVFWILATWTGFLFGRDILNDQRLGLCLAVFIATAIGFQATWLGVKAHLFSYFAFILAIYLIERIDALRRDADWLDIAILAMIVGISTFANGLILPLLIYCFLRGGWKLGVCRGLFFLAIAVSPIVSVKLGFKILGASGGDRTDTVLISLFFDHMRMIYQSIIGEQPEPVTFIHTTFTDPLMPFRWISGYFLNLQMLFGPTGLALSLVAIIPPWGKTQAVAVAAIAAVVIAVVGVQTYWPFWVFQGYTSYYVFVGFFVLMALGVLRVAHFAGIAAGSMSPESVHSVTTFVAVAVVLAWAVHSLSHLVSREYLAFYRFFTVHYLEFPADWNFLRENW